MTDYLCRIADRILRKKLSQYAAVLIEGCYGSGKTTTALAHADNILYLLSSNNHQPTYTKMIDVAPDKLLSEPFPQIIQEWHTVPNIPNAVKTHIEKSNSIKGQFILTSAKQSKQLPTMDVSRILMRPLSLYESQESSGTVSLTQLFHGCDNVFGDNLLRNLDDIAASICRGGWPQAQFLKVPDDLLVSHDLYEHVLHTDPALVDDFKRTPHITKDIIKFYTSYIGKHTGTFQIFVDMECEMRANRPAYGTIKRYLDTLRQLFIIEETPAWIPPLKTKAIIRTTPTAYFVDPSIGAAALDLYPETLTNDIYLFEKLFKNLCMRDLRIYADAIGGTVYNYRDNNGLECDAVIQLPDGKYGLANFTLGGTDGILNAIKRLVRFNDILDTDKIQQPAFKAVITATGDLAYTQTDFHIIPIASLKD